MKSKIILLICALVLISGCGSDSLLKRSANNKLIDMKGFDGGKRRPLYNRKYIDRAKYNIAQSDFDEEDEDEDEENIHPSVRHRYMYKDMVEREYRNRNNKKIKPKKRGMYRDNMRTRDEYPDISHAREIALENDDSDSNVELRQELNEIKSLLHSARKDLTKYKCPLQAEKNNTPVPIKHKKLPTKTPVENNSSRSYNNAGPMPAKTTHEVEMAEPAQSVQQQNAHAAEDNIPVQQPVQHIEQVSVPQAKQQPQQVETPAQPQPQQVKQHEAPPPQVQSEQSQHKENSNNLPALPSLK